MNITEQLIERFFRDQCSDGEASAVIAYLEEHPDMMEKYLGEKEWLAFEQQQRLHPVISEKILEAVYRQTILKKKRSISVKLAAAAAVILAIGFGSYLIIPSSVQPEKTLAEKTNVDQTVPVLKHIKNNSGKTETKIFPDGSVIMLTENSELRYYEPYENNARRFYLTGEASFKVAKDSLKPFVVYSDEISTTALGTEFIVKAWEQADLITVKLIEGKVLIKKEIDTKDWKKDYTLVAGDVFNYKRTTGKPTLIAAVKPEVNAKEKISNANKKGQGSNWYMFNNQKLPQVLDQLAAIYEVRITYSARELNNMNFIGKIDKSDSIENILQDIALLNNLKVTKTGKGYSVQKK